MNKGKLTGQNLGWVFNSRLGRVCICHAITCITKRPSLKLKTQLKQLLGYFPLAFALPTPAQFLLLNKKTKALQIATLTKWCSTRTMWQKMNTKSITTLVHVLNLFFCKALSLTGEKLKPVWAELSTISWLVLPINTAMSYIIKYTFLMFKSLIMPN